MAADAQWLRDTKWGVFIHFLSEHLDKDAKVATPSEWNKAVNAFDVEFLADQLEEAQAGYLILTLGQNSGYFCSPNPVYDELVGYPESHCSERDLMLDMHTALAKRGIELIAYLPGGAPEKDTQAVEKLEWQKGGPDRLVNFQRKWESICAYWSKAWGPKVRGWWIDGCWFADTMYRFEDEPNFKSFAAALKAGNPDSLVAFNPGLRLPAIDSPTRFEDMTAGECLDILYLGTYDKDEKGNWGGYYDFIDGKAYEAQLHIYCSLKAYLRGVPYYECPPRFPQELVNGYTKYLNDRGGVISWETPITATGGLIDCFHKQLVALGKATKG